MSSGSEPYPDFHLDRQKLIEIGAETIAGYVYSTEHIENQVGFYTRYLQRKDIMTSHRERANQNLDRYMFELAYREGVYADYRKVEDVECELGG
jgi:hypothetical protein